MKIKKVVCSAGKTGFFFDDQKAIKSGAKVDGNIYVGEPKTEGFQNIRVAGESISVMLVLEDGQVAYGDCAAVQYSGAGGRDPLFIAEDFIKVIKEYVEPILIDVELTSFRDLSKMVEDIVKKDGKGLHTAIRYGVTQAILDAVAKANKKLMCEVLSEEYKTTLSKTMIPIFTQSGDDRYLNADKMILKGADVLPHALFNHISKTGEKGEKLLEYIVWLKNRIIEHGGVGYSPDIHIDVYGMLGIVFDNDIEAIANYLGEVEKAASPLNIRIEGPVDAGNREDTMCALRDIRIACEKKGINVPIVADEWCNTLEDVIYFADNKAGHWAQVKTPDLGGINNSIEAILYCKEKNFGAYLGGTCNETERSAQVCTHISVAISPDQMLAKPGMGVDEGFMIVYNEMSRILALLSK
ncbi:MAG: methylaspartate ammonia-lyase [Lachnospirales bacterium]